MKNKLILCFCLILLSSCLFAANVEWHSGYVVTHQGDTLRGLVGYQDRTESWTRCQYKASEKDTVVSYFSWEIKGCGLDSGLSYESHRIQDDEINAIYLIRCLVKGNVSLYDVSIRKEDFTLYNRYYIVDSIHNRKLYMKPAEEATLPGIGEKRIRATLKVLFSDNSNIQKEIDKFNNKPGELAGLFRKYNDLMCNEERCVIYVEQPRRRKFWITPFISGHRNGFYEDGHSYAPSGGIGGSMNLDSQSEKWIMNVELELTTANMDFETVYTDLNMNRYYYDNKFKSINLYNTISFEYRFGNKMRPLLEAGLFQQGVFPTENSRLGRTDGSHSKLLYRNYVLGLMAGVGVAFPFGKGNYVPVKLRGYLPCAGKRYFDIENNVLSLSVGVSFKVK